MTDRQSEKPEIYQQELKHSNPDHVDHCSGPEDVVDAEALGVNEKALLRKT